MKKTITLSSILLAAVCAHAQLPVSTVPQKKNVILEEYTGTHCGFCPEGHKIADDLAKANPGKVFVINVHNYNSPSAGEPEFRTPFNSSLDSIADVQGYPAGAINRHVFSGMSQGSGPAMSRGTFATAAGQILPQASYLNVALQGNINPNDRKLTVDVEVYYTDNSPASTNFLNVVLVQDSILGPQSGGSAYPAMMVGSQYQHNKVLRHMLTGQWGDKISATTKGSKFSKQYTYIIPAQLPATVPSGAIKTNVLLSKLRAIAFVTETKQEVVSGALGTISLSTTTGIDAVSLNGKISISPSLVTDYAIVGLRNTNATDVSLNIFDINGKQVYSHNTTKLSAGQNEITIDTRSFSAGIYSVVVTTNEGMYTEKLVVAK
jgi:thiol-disulfide isomerase/thioredoxin